MSKKSIKKAGNKNSKKQVKDVIIDVKHSIPTLKGVISIDVTYVNDIALYDDAAFDKLSKQERALAEMMLELLIKTQLQSKELIDVSRK